MTAQKRRMRLLIIGSLSLVLLGYFTYPLVLLSAASAQLERAIAQNDHALLQRAISQLEQPSFWQTSETLRYRRLGQGYIYSGRVTDAIKSLEQARALQPDSLLIGSELVTAYLSINNVLMAAQVFRDVGMPSTFLTAHAYRLWKEQEYFDLEKYLQIIEINGEDMFSSRQFVAAQLARLQDDKATESVLLHEAVTADHGWLSTSMRSWAFVRYAEALIQQKQFDAALQVINTALTTTEGAFSKQDMSAVYRLRGLAFQGIGDIPNAESDLKQAVVLEPTYGWGWMSLGALHYTIRGEGFAEVDRALALEPTNRDLWSYWLAVLAAKRDVQKLAWYCVQASQYQINPNDVCLNQPRDDQ